MSPVTADQDKVIWEDESTATEMVGAFGLVYLETAAAGNESPDVELEVHIVNEYWVPGVRPVIDLVVTFVEAVVVDPEVQLAGAEAPLW